MTDYVHDPKNPEPINNLYAYLSVDGQGNEGIAGVNGIPFIFGYEHRALMVLPMIENVAKQTNKKIILAKFTNKEIIKTISHGGN